MMSSVCSLPVLVALSSFYSFVGIRNGKVVFIFYNVIMCKAIHLHILYIIRGSVHEE